VSELGKPHRHYRRCDSTNLRARELAAGGAPGGTVVTAAEQTAGRGRQGRRWQAPAGKALLYSAILRPHPESALLPLAVALAVAETAEALAPVEARVKWPNDVWLGDRKLAGVLIEARPAEGWAVVGVGLNLAVEPGELPPEVAERAASLGHNATPERATESLNAALAEWLRAPASRVLAEFRRRDALVGRSVSWDGGFGIAAGIDDIGHLLVDTGGGSTVTLGAGEVHLSVG
jgi:BirA family transcriptional regulator, biotin operon repressor / biotin---[acetyl-CoA-carboxylase] ligase